ncbi:hypothetical protein Krac_3368 [Ktedonobacter racemifer DSM 44963]|uniref:Uncharacterized protein n=1 Tax=Ktedonobacter racemifer DSM 44963 TaxID=485913 RepID=D6U159_KTERA|nr:hypothetical protein Krac_3368 [Ktedonobacter racemifer DSM 44963]
MRLTAVVVFWRGCVARAFLQSGNGAFFSAVTAESSLFRSMYLYYPLLCPW